MTLKRRVDITKEAREVKNINNVAVPWPLHIDEMLKGDIYYVTSTNIHPDLYVGPCVFRSSKFEYEDTLIDKGICHRKKEYAIIHAKSLLSFFVDQ